MAIQFGDQRLYTKTTAERLAYRLFGLLDPAHFLHARNFVMALDKLDLHPHRILDAGSGRGDFSIYLAQRFPSAQVVAVNADDSRIARSRDAAHAMGLANIDFRVADLTRDMLGTGYDLVLSIDVLEHVAEQQLAISRLADALVSKGVGYFHIPTVRPKPVPLSGHLHEFHDWAEHAHLADEKTASEFIRSVKASGLEILSSRPTFGYYTGELAVSLFALPYRDTFVNRVTSAALAPACRFLALVNPWRSETTYAVEVIARKS